MGTDKASERRRLPAEQLGAPEPSAARRLGDAAAGASERNNCDSATLRACQRGDERAFRRLVEAYQQPVYSLCVALAGPDGEDLAQETFLRVFQAIPRFDVSRPTGVRPWILCIARRLCQDRARHKKLGVEVLPAEPVDAPDPAAGPEERVSAARMGDRFRAALDALPEEQRAVVALFEWEGLDYEEIATIEGVPVGTVRSRLSRARAALRQAVAVEEPSDIEERLAHVR
jgi:RNA polymerase sigma-70 factor, ECF subfamily